MRTSRDMGDETRNQKSQKPSAKIIEVALDESRPFSPYPNETTRRADRPRYDGIPIRRRARPRVRLAQARRLSRGKESNHAIHDTKKRQDDEGRIPRDDGGSGRRKDGALRKIYLSELRRQRQPIELLQLNVVRRDLHVWRLPISSGIGGSEFHENVHIEFQHRLRYARRQMIQNRRPARKDRKRASHGYQQRQPDRYRIRIRRLVFRRYFIYRPRRVRRPRKRSLRSSDLRQRVSLRIYMICFSAPIRQSDEIARFASLSQ